MSDRLVLGTRGSALARAQSEWVAAQLQGAWPEPLEVELLIIETRGDRIQDRPLPEIGGKGLFTEELEGALREGRIDFAVHSLKDLPTQMPADLVLASVPVREDPSDVMVGGPLSGLPPGARVGTGSVRRQAFLRDVRPDLVAEGIRGNVDTRLRKQSEGLYDAIILASAGLRRLRLSVAAHPLPTDLFVPAPGQGALGVQCRAQDGRTQEILKGIDHAMTRLCCHAERTFLDAIGGGCSVPAGALATIQKGDMTLRAALVVDGVVRRVALRGGAESGEELGQEAAQKLRG